MQHDEPKSAGLSVSVVMVVRNGADHIEHALASLMRAGRTPLEIIVVDGNSSDATVAIAGRNPLVRIVRQAGTGVADAYNLGIAQARGEVIAFLSHDDLWTDGKLAIQMPLLEADPAIMLSFGHVCHVLAGDPPPNFRRDLLDRSVPGYIMETLVARREAFTLVGPFDTAFSSGEDVDWISRARDLGLPTALAAETILTKRIHASNTSLSDANNTANLLLALRRTVQRRSES